MGEEIITKLDSLNLVDKFLFDETMEIEEAYEIMISILLEEEIHLISKVETEKELRVSPELRQIRLDVIGTDREQRVYFAEMQGKNTYNLPRRSRYYQSHVDVSLLPPGTVDFNELPDACLILIAPFDIFGRGLYRYTFLGQCLECPDLVLKDGATRIFINTQGKNPEDFSEEFLDLMEYITDSSDEVSDRTKSVRLKRIHEIVKEIKKSEKVGVKYMQTWEEQMMIRKEGREEGREEGILYILGELLKKGKITFEDALQQSGLTEESFREKTKSY